MQLVEMSRFCIPKKFTQRQINRVDKVIWEMLKHTHIIKQRKLEEQDEEQDFNEIFFTHLQKVHIESSPQKNVLNLECLVNNP
jgi:hypothetical protein